MYRFAILLVFIVQAIAFGPARMTRSSTGLKMSMDKASKTFGAALIGVGMFVSPAFAVEGAGPKQSIFGGGNSSPFTFDEKREDPIYSPYSPYGDASKAVYKEAGKDEMAFWIQTFDKCEKRMDEVPKFAKKKVWTSVDTTMRTYVYNMREAMNRLAAQSKNPAAAKAAADKYFVDLNDISEGSFLQNSDKILASFETSKADLTTFKSLVKK